MCGMVSDLIKVILELWLCLVGDCDPAPGWWRLRATKGPDGHQLIVEEEQAGQEKRELQRLVWSVYRR